jgi:MerR family transcriptional regulator, copper efflux regulator
MERPLTIGQLADLSGVSTATLRYYERVGLLPAPQRTAAGYRLYPRQTVNRLHIVRNAQRFGFSLNEIAKFLRVKDSGGKPCHDVRAEAQRLLDAVDAQIQQLLAARKRMRQTLQQWDKALESTPKNSPARLLERLSDGNVATPVRNTLTNRGRVGRSRE